MTASEAKGPDGRQVRWQAHNRARREKIIDAAVAEVERQEPGAEIHLQEIADRAGLSRTVIYRHFQDRADLDLAVQRRVIEQVGAAVLPAATFEGTPVDIIRRIVAAYVRWAVAHPALHRVAEQGVPNAEESPLDQVLGQIAEQVEAIMTAVVDLLGAELSEDDRAALDPWVFGIIGGCFASTRRWSARETLEPGVTGFVEMMTEVIWYQINGLAASRGINLPDVPVEQISVLDDQDDE